MEYKFWSAKIYIDTGNSLSFWELIGVNDVDFPDVFAIEMEYLDGLSNEYTELKDKFPTLLDESLKTLATTNLQETTCLLNLKIFILKKIYKIKLMNY